MKEMITNEVTTDGGMFLIGSKPPIYLYLELGLSHKGRSKKQWMVSLVILW